MDRSNENIKNLLEKYWAGESSLEDEKKIYSYFNGDNIDPELKEFAPLFNFFDSERLSEIDITGRLFEKIENLENKSTTTGIDGLLEKYWAGETTLEDEQILNLYFNQTVLEAHHKELIPYFNYLKTERNISIDVTDQVMQKIKMPVAQPKVIQLGWRRIISVAASILLVLSISLAVFQYQQIKKPEISPLDTYQSPEEALEQTKAALAYLSARMNRGTDKAVNGIIMTETLEIINQ